MVEFTQGTVVYGVRCTKYPLTPCYAIIITARCDIANSKINKVFNIVGIPLSKWILSNQGYSEIVKAKIKSIKKDMERILSKYDLDLDSILSFTDVEINTVFSDSNVVKKDNDNFFNLLSSYKEYISNELSIVQKKKILKELESSVVSTVKNIASGKDLHYIIVPSNSIKKLVDKDVEDLVIDLQEIDYWPINIVEKLVKCDVDAKGTRLNKNEKTEFDKYFFLSEEPCYAEIIGEVSSPWIEFVMQRFTNFFARIGVDFISENRIKKLITIALE